MDSAMLQCCVLGWLISSILLIVNIPFQMYNHANHIAHLNEQITKKDNSIARLRAAYTRHLNELDTLRREVEDLRTNNTELLDRVRTSERRNDNLKNELSTLKPNPHYKQYSELTSKSGKQDRKRECRSIFNSVLRNMSGHIKSQYKC